MNRRSVLLVTVLAYVAGCGGAQTAQPNGDRTCGFALGQEQEALARASRELEARREPLAGLRLVELPSSSPVLDVRVVFDAGSADDPVGKEGLTALTARLMAEGAAGELTYAAREAALFPMAASIDVQVDREQTTFIGRVHRDHVARYLELLLDVLVRPQLLPNELERVREQQQSELLLGLRGNDDEELGKEALESMLYEGQPYGHPELGTERGLAAITRDDVVAQRGRVFCGGRATLGLAGAVPIQSSLAGGGLVGQLTTLGEGTCEGRAALPAMPRREARVWLVEKAEAASTAVSMGLPLDVTRADADYPALLLASVYFGQHRQFAGRLMQKLRGDRGLNYGDYAYVEHFVQEGWSCYPAANTARREQYFSMWLRPVPHDKAHFAIRMAVRELRDLVARGISPEDFARIREFASQYFGLYLQTDSRRLGFAIDDRFYGQEDAWLARVRAAWANLTAADVNAAIARHVDPSRLEIAVVTSDGAALRDALASERPSPITYEAPPAEAVLAEDREIVPYRIGIPAERMTVVPVAQMFR
jgi:zinc protease